MKKPMFAAAKALAVVAIITEDRLAPVLENSESRRSLPAWLNSLILSNASVRPMQGEAAD
jgi:hypothetical protein